jgi:GNAT superfamily N-acetyltransferase
MEFELLGWPADGPTLRLDYEQFSYAGKFVMSATGKAVVRNGNSDSPGWTEGEDSGGPTGADGSDGTRGGDGEYDTDVLGAVAFDADRTDGTTLRCRYITVRRDHRGEGLGPRLLRFVADRALDRGYDRVSIAVNNPYAYEAAYRAGFAYTGDRTGLAELLCATPPEDAGRERYQAGLDHYRERDLTPEEEAFLAARDDPPETVDAPETVDST